MKSDRPRRARGAGRTSIAVRIAVRAALCACVRSPPPRCSGYEKQRQSAARDDSRSFMRAAGSVLWGLRGRAGLARAGAGDLEGAGIRVLLPEPDDLLLLSQPGGETATNSADTRRARPGESTRGRLPVGSGAHAARDCDYDSTCRGHATSDS